MNNTACDCKDNRIYYVLAGGGLVLLTYFIKNATQTSQQQLHLQSQQSSPYQEQINNTYKVNELENQIDILKNQLDDKIKSVQRYQQYKNSKSDQPKILTIKQMNDKEEDKKRRFMFNMV